MTTPSQADEPVNSKCIKCGAEVTPPAIFCPICGAAQIKPTSTLIKCFACGVEIPQFAKFCEECGAAQTTSATGATVQDGATGSSGKDARTCRMCRATVPTTADFCGVCGAHNPTSSFVNCPDCGTEISVNQKFCYKCGKLSPLPNPPASSQPNYQPPSQPSNATPFVPQGQPPALMSPAWSYLPTYYQEEFYKMQSRPEYEGKWNWAAFSWGCFWAMSKGLWGPVLVTVGVFILTAPVGGFPALLTWFYFGFRGNSMYYKKIVLGQSWALW